MMIGFQGTPPPPLDLLVLQLAFRKRPDSSPVRRLFHYDITIKWPVRLG